MSCHVIHGTFMEDGSAVLMARLVGIDTSGSTITGEGRLATQMDIAEARLFVYALGLTPTQTLTSNLAISTVVFDSLQTLGWPVDSTGYNFRTIIAPEAFPSGCIEYRAEVRFTTTGGAVSWGRWQGQAIQVAAS